MFLAGTAIVCSVVPLSITSANGAPAAEAPADSSALQTPAPEGNVKVKGGKTSDEATPAPITYNTIDGIWEVQLQPGSQTIYSHFNLLTSAAGVSGSWNRNNVLTPLSGNQTGDRFGFSGTDAKGQFVMTGYIENSATMIGEVTRGQQMTAFTATHQGLPLNERGPKQKHAHHRRHKDAETPNADTMMTAPTPSP